MYLLDLGTAIDLGVILNFTSMGSQVCLPYMRKDGLKPVAKLQVPLNMFTRAPVLFSQFDMCSRSNISSKLIRVEMNLSHCPFVWGWYGLVLSFLLPVILQRSVINSFPKFLPWLDKIFSSKVVPQCFGCCLGSLGLGNIYLCIPGKTVGYYQDVLIFPFTQHRQSMLTSSRGWVATIFSMWALCCSALKVMHWCQFSTCSCMWTVTWGQKKWWHIKVANFIVTALQNGIFVFGQQS